MRVCLCTHVCACVSVRDSFLEMRYSCCWPWVTQSGSYRLNGLAAVAVTPWTEVWGATQPGDGRSLPHTRPRRSGCRSRGRRPQGCVAWARAAGGGRPRSAAFAPFGVSAFSLRTPLPASQTQSGGKCWGGCLRPGRPWAGALWHHLRCSLMLLVTGVSCWVQEWCECLAEGVGLPKRSWLPAPRLGGRPGRHGRAPCRGPVSTTVKSPRCLFGSQREGRAGCGGPASWPAAQLFPKRSASE